MSEAMTPQQMRVTSLTKVFSSRIRRVLNLGDCKICEEQEVARTYVPFPGAGLNVCDDCRRRLVTTGHYRPVWVE